MEQEFSGQNTNPDPLEGKWRGLYRIAGIGAILAVVFMLLDIALSFTGGDVEVGGLSAVDWFNQFESNWFVALRNLGLFNVINLLLTLPLYLALFHVHRKAAPAFATLALILYILGAAIYDANNRSLALLALSQQYSAAVTEAQKTLLATAGTVILAQAEDFTPGSFIGFFLSGFASVLMTAVMLRGRIFNKWIAVTGLVGTSALLFFTITATFIPTIFQLAMVFALFGGLLMLAWNILMAFGMFRMSRGKTVSEASRSSFTQAATKQV